MRVCDRHPTAKAADELMLKSDGSPVDLCVECVALVREFIGKPEATTVDPQPPPKRGLLDRITKR